MKKRTEVKARNVARIVTGMREKKTNKQRFGAHTSAKPGVTEGHRALESLTRTDEE